MIVWHTLGVDDRCPNYPTLPEIEDTLYDAALLLCVWIVLTSLF